MLNAYSQLPSPATVGQGALLWIEGINLGPAARFQAGKGEWPLEVGDPALQVLVGNRRAAIGEASPGKLLVQVPVDAPPGNTAIVVRRGNVNSAPARITVQALNPSLLAQDGLGYGSAGESSGNLLRLRVTGLGPAEPRLETGQIGEGEQEISLVATVRTEVGGRPANSVLRKGDGPGQYQLEVTLPTGVQPGDPVAVYANNAVSNRLFYAPLAKAAVAYRPVPEEFADARILVASDTAPGFALLQRARGADGCFPTLLVDMVGSNTGKVNHCLTAPTPGNANNPGGAGGGANQAAAVAGNETAAIAALAGPPLSTTAGEGVSEKLLLFQPGQAEPVTVALPAAASNVGGGQPGLFNVVLAGNPPRPMQVDSRSGEVVEPQGGNGGNNPGGNNPVLQPGLVANLTSIDLGDGVKELVSTPTLANQLGLILVVAVDSVERPTKGKLGALNGNGEVRFSTPLPEGWLPLLAPVGNAPGNPGNPGGNAGALANRLRTAFAWDGPMRTLHLLARAADGSRDGMVRFVVEAGAEPASATAAVTAMPPGQFAASCSNPLRLFPIEISRRVAVATSDVLETTVKNPCAGVGFAVYTLDQPTLTMVPLPGQGQYNAAANGSNEMNDYVYGTNTDPARQGRSDTLYVLDGVNNGAFRLDLPAEIGSFLNLVPFPAMGLLVGLGNTSAARVNGDAGLVVFDLENAEARILPVPVGFTNVQLLSVLNSSRSVLARGVRSDGPGTQLLVYDLVTRDVQIIPNPEGCAFVGQAPAAQGGGANQQPVAITYFAPRSAQVMVGCFNAQRQMVGLLSVKVN